MLTPGNKEQGFFTHFGIWMMWQDAKSRNSCSLKEFNTFWFLVGKTFICCAPCVISGEPMDSRRKGEMKWPVKPILYKNLGTSFHHMTVLKHWWNSRTHLQSTDDLFQRQDALWTSNEGGRGQPEDLVQIRFIQTIEAYKFHDAPQQKRTAG